MLLLATFASSVRLGSSLQASRKSAMHALMAPSRAIMTQHMPSAHIVLVDIHGYPSPLARGVLWENLMKDAKKAPNADSVLRGSIKMRRAQTGVNYAVREKQHLLARQHFAKSANLVDSKKT